MKNQFTLKPYSLKELSAHYGVSRHTLSRWLTPFQKEIGIRNGHFYSIVQVKIIFEKLGTPGSLIDG